MYKNKYRVFRDIGIKDSSTYYNWGPDITANDPEEAVLIAAEDLMRTPTEDYDIEGVKIEDVKFIVSDLGFGASKLKGPYKVVKSKLSVVEVNKNEG